MARPDRLLLDRLDGDLAMFEAVELFHAGLDPADRARTDTIMREHRLPERLGNARFDALLGLLVTRPSYLKFAEVERPRANDAGVIPSSCQPCRHAICMPRFHGTSSTSGAAGAHPSMTEAQLFSRECWRRGRRGTVRCRYR